MFSCFHVFFFRDGRRLMVLSWAGFIHFFDVPASSNVKQDASPAAAFQEISPTISVSMYILRIYFLSTGFLLHLVDIFVSKSYTSIRVQGKLSDLFGFAGYVRGGR